MYCFSKKIGGFHRKNRHYPLYLILLALMLLNPVLSSRVEAENHTLDLFNRGLKELIEGDIDSAKTAFLSVISIEPTHAGAFYHLGVIALSKGQIDHALEYLKQAAQLKPEFLATFLRMAEAYEQRGHLEEALQSLSSASKLIKDRSDPVAKATSQGLIRLKGRIKTQEDMREGIRLLRAGESLAARKFFQDILSAETDNPDVHHFLAVSLGMEGRLEEAIKHFKTALRLKPDLSNARSRLIDIYLSTGALENARDAVERALFFLDDQQGLSAQGLELQLNRIEDQMLGKRLMDKAMQQLEDNKTNAAIETFKALIQSDPAHSLAYYNLGILSARQKKFELAIPFFEKAIEINPQYREAHERLAQIYELTRIYSHAIKHYEEALAVSVDPDTPSAQALRESISRIKAEQVKASMAADEALRQGKNALGQQKLETAIQYYEQASALNREDPEIRYQLGLLYEDFKRPDLATAAMQAVIELLPSHLPARRYLARRDEANGFLYQALKRWREVNNQAGEVNTREVSTNEVTSNEEDINSEELTRLEGLINSIEAETIPLMTQASRLAEAGKSVAAIKLLKKARTLAPDDPRIRRLLATLYETSNLSIEAFQALSAARLLEPEQASHYLALAKLYENAGQWSDAEIHFRKTLQAKIGADRLKDAAKQGLNLAIKKQQDIKAAGRYLERARRYHLKQDHRAAIAWYEKVFRLFPAHTDSLYRAAVAYESLGDYTAATHLYQAILKVDEQNTLAHQRLGFISEIEGQIETAIQHYERHLVLWKGQENRETLWVKKRLKPLNKGLHISLNQVLLSYDSNPSRSTKPQPDLRSSAGIGLSYLLRKNRRLQIPIGFSSDTIFFFESNLLFSQQSLSIAAKGARRPFSYALGYDFQFGISDGGPTGFDHIASLNLEWFSKADYSTAFDLSFDRFISPASKRFNAKRSMLSLTGRKNGRGNRSSLSYTLRKNDAKLNDQASVSQGLGLSYSRAFSERLNTALSYEITLTRFDNIDSFGKKRRENISQTVHLALSYRLEEGVFLSASLVEQRNHSNLPASSGSSAEQELSGQSATTEQLLAGQAASLGDYRQRIISASISWSF